VAAFFRPCPSVRNAQSEFIILHPERHLNPLLFLSEPSEYHFIGPIS
jgi:hypothetical protein